MAAESHPLGGAERVEPLTPGELVAAALLLAALLGGLLLTIAGSSTLWDRDEPRFCRAAVEMQETGDLLVPRFGDRLRPDKPIWIYWLMVGSLELFGRSELALRLPSVLGMLTVLLVTCRIGTLLFDGETGLRAMLIMGTGLLPIAIGTAATADGQLNGWLLLALLPIVERVARGPAWWQLPLLALALGVGWLAKGPVALAVVAGAAIGVRAFLGPDPALGAGWWLGLLLAVVASVGIFLAWAIPANQATDGEFLRAGIGKHVVQRMVEPAENHGGQGIKYLLLLPFHAIVLLIGLFPWTHHVAGAVAGVLGGTLGERRSRAVLLGWAAPTFLLMSLIATKLPHYTLPIFPAVAIAVAASLREGALDARAAAWRARLTPLTGALLVLLGIGLPIAGLALDPGGPLLWRALPAALVLLGGAGFALRRPAEAQLVPLALMMLLLGPALSLGVVPRVEAMHKVGPRIAAAVAADPIASDPQTPITVYRYSEPSTAFYLARPARRPVRELSRISEEHPQLIPAEGNKARVWARQPGRSVLVTTAAVADELSAAERVGLRVIFREPIINYTKGRRVEVVVLVRDRPGRSPWHWDALAERRPGR